MKQTNKYSEVGGWSVPRIGGDLLLGDAPFSHRNWYSRSKNRSEDWKRRINTATMAEKLLFFPFSSPFCGHARLLNWLWPDFPRGKFCSGPPRIRGFSLFPYFRKVCSPDWMKELQIRFAFAIYSDLSLSLCCLCSCLCGGCVVGHVEASRPRKRSNLVFEHRLTSSDFINIEVPRI